MALSLASTRGQAHTLAPSNVRVTSSRVGSSEHAHAFTSSFMGRTSYLRMCNTMRSSNGSVGKGKFAGRLRVTCWFKFGKRGMDAEGAGIYGSQTRDDFDRDDVEQYFNYMGMLAVEGSYDKMEALLNKNIHPVDILLLLAASEGDKPKIEELMRAGADYTVTDAEGRTALDRAADEETRNLIVKFPR